MLSAASAGHRKNPNAGSENSECAGPRGIARTQCALRPPFETVPAARVLHSKRQHGFAGRSVTSARDIDAARSGVRDKDGMLEPSLPKKNKVSCVSCNRLKIGRTA